MADLYFLFKDFGGHAIASLGIVGGVYGYFRHDRKLKEQEKRLNELQIRQYEKEEAKEKMADIKVNSYRRGSGSACIQVVNAGKAKAYNVRIEILDSKEKLESIIINNPWGPYEMINSQSSMEERIALCEGCPKILSLKIRWDDAYSKDREDIFAVKI